MEFVRIKSFLKDKKTKFSIEEVFDLLWDALQKDLAVYYMNDEKNCWDALKVDCLRETLSKNSEKLILRDFCYENLYGRLPQGQKPPLLKTNYPLICH